MFRNTDINRFTFIFSYLKAQRFHLIGLFVLIAVNIFLQIYNPLYVKSFIDDARAGNEQSVLLRTAGVFLSLTLVRQAVTIVIQYVTSDVTWKITNKLRLDLTDRSLSYDLSFHNQRTPGEMVDRIDGDVGKLSNYLSAFALKVVGNNLLIMGTIVFIFFIHPLIGAVVAIAFMLGLYVLIKMSTFGTKTMRDYSSESARYIGFIDEQIAGREDIRAFHAEKYVLRKFYERLRRLYRIRKKTGFNIATVLNVGEIVLALIMVCTILTMGLIYHYDTSLSLGTMILVYFYVTILLVPLKNIVHEINDLQQINASLLRINELLDYKNKVEDRGTLPITEDHLAVRFDQVSFGYDDANHVIHNISFDIPANKSVGIIGRTGSGKSTVARLLYRLCDAQQGTISINGTDIKQIALEDLRTNIAVISQNVELFEGTLRENITMFRENIEDQLIYDIFDRISLRDWIRKTPEELDKPIERDGKNVSAGEAQLIAFARAFLKKPRIVIMDEATSRIDPLTEKLMGKAISALLKETTAIIIAHRLSTIKQTDYIVVMQHGKVIEFGETVTLEKDPRSAYCTMINEGGQIYA